MKSLSNTYEFFAQRIFVHECRRVQRECRGMQGEYSNKTITPCSLFQMAPTQIVTAAFSRRSVDVVIAQTNERRGMQRECKMARKLVRTELMAGKAWEPISVRREQANDANWVWKQSNSWRQPFHDIVCEVVIAQTNQRRGIQREFKRNSVKRCFFNISLLPAKNNGMIKMLNEKGAL